jgi:hypothetical protein
MLRSMMGFGQPAEILDTSMGEGPPCAGFLVRLILTTTSQTRFGRVHHLALDSTGCCGAVKLSTEA